MTEIGRRERKKQATAGAIERAALELVRERGMDETTVEAISERADVTSRTFFNYFASKEDAVLGHAKTATPHFDVADLVALPGSAFDRVRAMITEKLADAGPAEAERTALRREAMGRHPELIGRELRWMVQVSSDLLSSLESSLRDEDPTADDSEVHRRAVAIANVIGAAFHTAVQLWSEDSSGSTTLAGHFDAAFDLILDVATRVRA